MPRWSNAPDRRQEPGSLVLFYAIVALTNRTEYAFTIKKSIFVVAGVVLAVPPFYLYIDSDAPYFKRGFNDKLKLSYFIAVLPGLLFYKRPPGKAEMGEMEDVLHPPAEE
jgi:hypothetical protein